MFTDKKGLFKEFDVVVNGKFVALLVAPYESYQGMYGVFEFYFGVYNHKYFSMCPKFTVDCYNPCGSSEDFRLATDEEKNEFFNDCRSFGYDWDVENHHFLHNNMTHILETKKQFLDMKLPKYVPLSKIDGEIVLEILKFNNEDGDMFFVLDDNYYSHIKTRYMVCNNSDCTFIDILKYECDESFDGHHLIEGLGGEDRFTNLKDDDLVFGVARLCWWFFVDKFFDFSLRYSTDTKPNDFSKLTLEHLTEFGKMMIGQGWVDDKIIFQLAREYMQFGWFCSLCGELANIRRIELESKKNSIFEL